MCIRDSDQATVSVTVNAATIVANDDTGTPVNGYAGGTAVANVLVNDLLNGCLLYTSDAADERSSVDLGGRRIIKKKNKNIHDSCVSTATHVTAQMCYTPSRRQLTSARHTINTLCKGWRVHLSQHTHPTR